MTEDQTAERVMVLSYKYRIYPSKTVEAKLIHTLEVCRKVYNQLLEYINTARKEGRKVNWVDTSALIKEYRKRDPDIKAVYARILYQVNKQLWANIKVLQKLKKNGKKVGKLRYKTSPNSFKTFCYNLSGFKVDTARRRLVLSKIGEIPIKLHRPLEGRVKEVLIKKTKTGKWYAIFHTEVVIKKLPKVNRAVGIDLGIQTFCVDSEGVSFENPKFMDKTLEKIKKLQKKVSRKCKGSKNWEKAKVKLAKLYDKLNNQRLDYLHKLSRYYVNNYDVICVEDLNIRGMVENSKAEAMNRHILDSAWSNFVFMLAYKAERAGRRVIFVNPKNTSKTCARCGYVVEKLTLKDRRFKCPVCGWEANRDYNASLNILYVGLGRPRTPVEREPLLLEIPCKKVLEGQALSRKQEVALIQ